MSSIAKSLKKENDFTCIKLEITTFQEVGYYSNNILIFNVG